MALKSKLHSWWGSNSREKLCPVQLLPRDDAPLRTAGTPGDMTAPVFKVDLHSQEEGRSRCLYPLVQLRPRQTRVAATRMVGMSPICVSCGTKSKTVVIVS